MATFVIKYLLFQLYAHNKGDQKHEKSLRR